MHPCVLACSYSQGREHAPLAIFLTTYFAHDLYMMIYCRCLDHPQVIFASSPLWSAVLASAVLGERMGPLAWAGGAAILAASFAVSRAEDTSHASPTPSTAAPSSKASE